MTDLPTVERLLEPFGLVVLGVLDDLEDEGFLPPGTRQLLLVGNAGSSCWEPFTASPEYRDGRPDPMDRWSRRVGISLADELGAKPIFPFEGPPWPPMLDWARRAGRAQPSPIVMYIHEEFGLWHAYRFALALPGRLPVQARKTPLSSPCLSCPDQPCLGACPVDAFSPGEYRSPDCVAYLASGGQSDCRRQGCAARRACPYRPAFRYRAGHAQFHMDAFLRSQT